MAINLVDMVKNIFPSDASTSAANLLGENETNVRRALDAAIPTILAGVLGKAGSSPSELPAMLNSAKEQLGSGVLGSVFSGGSSATDNSSFVSKGISLLQGVFGDKLSSLLSTIAGFAGIKESSANTLLAAAAPAALGAIGQHAAVNNLDQGGILHFLSEQKDNIMAALPAGLSIGSLGLGSLLGSATEPKVTMNEPVGAPTETYVEQKKGGSGWLMWLFLLVLAALAIWYFTGEGCNKANEKTVITTDTMVTEITTETTISRESTLVMLPDGTELNAYKGGIEDQLVAFLKTDYVALGEDSLKNTWFNFDNLNFETGSTTITPESQAQINNLVAILKAFPKAKLKIGGYTDRVGNEDFNVKLSTDRAKAVAAALDAAGVGAQVVGAEGYGSQFAKFPADAMESDRETDRKVAVSLR